MAGSGCIELSGVCRLTVVLPPNRSTVLRREFVVPSLIMIGEPVRKLGDSSQSAVRSFAMWIGRSEASHDRDRHRIIVLYG